MSYGFDIWRVELSAVGIQVADHPLIASTRSDDRPCWSPRGDRIAFVSTRSGQREIWICDADGQNARQITDSGGSLTGSLCWSPDARSIAYSAFFDGWEAAYAVELASRQARRIRPAPRHQVVVAWSGDGAWIYFNTQRDGRWQIARMRQDGSTEQELGPSGCTLTALLPDPERIVFMAKDLTGFWLMSPATSETEFLIEDRTAIAWSSWVVTAGGAYFVRPGREGWLLGWYDGASKQSRILGPIAGQVVSDLCLAPDGRSLLFARTDRLEADLIRVERFR